MKMGISALRSFLKDPQYQADPETSFSYRVRTCIQLLVWALGLGVLLAMVLGILESIGPWDLDQHAFEALLEEYPAPVILALLVVVAPVFEETIFRAPLWFFRDSQYFKEAFYVSALLFGAVHLSNFPNFSEIWYLAVFLISPQIVLGLFLGYIRVRFGLAWAMAFHSAYNGILAGPFLLLLVLNAPVS